MGGACLWNNEILNILDKWRRQLIIALFSICFYLTVMIFVCWKSALHLFLFTFIQHPRSVRLRLSTLHTVQHLVFESFTDSLLANHTELGRKDVRCRASQRCAALLSAASSQMGRHLLGVVTPRREQQRHLANPTVGKFTFFRCKSLIRALSLSLLHHLFRHCLSIAFPTMFLSISP